MIKKVNKFTCEISNSKNVPFSSAFFSKMLKEFAVILIRIQDFKHYDEMWQFAHFFGKPSRCDDITNIGENGELRSLSSIESKQIKANEVWHVDMLASPNPPSLCLLYAQELPVKVVPETQFADLCELWSDQDKKLRAKFSSAYAVHSFSALAKRTGSDYPMELVKNYVPCRHPLLTKDPYSRRPVFYIGGHTENILTERGYFEGSIDDIIKGATNPNKIFSHKWSLGDLIVWNNRRVCHRVTPYDNGNEKRRLHRVEIMGEPPIQYSQGLLNNILNLIRK
jgi:alpha-ketoglutarate-dependent 2,4-dichlorophenoxyacetate dioxygenase